jgi:hypothetical protein
VGLRTASSTLLAQSALAGLQVINAGLTASGVQPHLAATLVVAGLVAALQFYVTNAANGVVPPGVCSRCGHPIEESK